MIEAVRGWGLKKGAAVVLAVAGDKLDVLESLKAP